MVPDISYIQSELAERGLCPSVFVYEVIDSTNTKAREILDGETQDILVLADSQSGGKGSHGRSFFSPSGTGLYFTASFSGLPFTFPVTFAAASASVAALGQFGIESCSKWVNDIMISGRKAGGILCERTASGNVIVGIGINIAEPEEGFPPEISGIAAALGNSDVSRDELAVRLYAELHRRMEMDPHEVMEKYRAVCGTTGRRITFDLDGTRAVGMADRILDDGTLEVLLDSGGIAELISGNVSIRYETQ